MKRSTLIFCLLLSTLTITAKADSLLQVYNQALANDPTYKLAHATWLQSKEALPQARALILPQIELKGTYGYNPKSLLSPSGNIHGWPFTYGISISDNLFNASAWYGIKNASSAVKAATAAYLSASQSLIQRTLSAYFTVLSDYASVQTDVAQKDATQKVLETTRQKFKVGLVAIKDLYSAQAKYDGTTAQQIADEITLQNDLEALGQITGQNYSQLKQLKTQVPLITPAPANINTWVKLASKQSFILEADRYTVLADKAGITQSALSRLPNLSLSASYSGTDASSKTDPNYPKTSQQNYGLALDFKPYQGGLISSNTRKAQAQYIMDTDQYQINYRQTLADTRNAYLGIQSYISKIKADAQTVKSDQKNLEGIKAGYTVGTSTMMNVLESLSTLYQDKQIYIKDQYSYLNTIVRLKQAAGTLSVKDVQTFNQWLQQNINLIKYDSSQSSTTPKQKKASTKKIINKPVKKTLPAPKSAQNSHYTIQVFASKSQAQATHYANSMPGEKLSVNYKKPWYRVTYGQFNSYQQAQHGLKQLAFKLRSSSPWVTRIN